MKTKKLTDEQKRLARNAASRAWKAKNKKKVKKWNQDWAAKQKKSKKKTIKKAVKTELLAV
jgi:hypothetical protein